LHSLYETRFIRINNWCQCRLIGENVRRQRNVSRSGDKRWRRTGWNLLLQHRALQRCDITLHQLHTVPGCLTDCCIPHAIDQSYLIYIWPIILNRTNIQIWGIILLANIDNQNWMNLEKHSHAYAATWQIYNFIWLTFYYRVLTCYIVKDACQIWCSKVIKWSIRQKLNTQFLWTTYNCWDRTTAEKNKI